MSGIYISGIKMPEKEQLVIFRIWGNGQVERLEGYRPFLLYGVKATDIPNHGRLIDADALENEVQMRLLECNKYGNQFQKPYEVMRTIALAPTIIESEGK